MKETVLCDHGQSASVTDTFGALEKADKAVSPEYQAVFMKDVRNLCLHFRV